MQQERLREHIILVDAAYLDKVSSRLLTDFQQMLGRSVSKADMAEWLLCCALDGGLQQGENTVQVTFVCPPDLKLLPSFSPSDLKGEMDGKAFKDACLGEFELSCIQEESINKESPLIVQCTDFILQNHGVKSLVIVADMQQYGEELKGLLGKETDTHVTILTMHTADGVECQQIMLGYSLMHAFGIKPEELSKQN